MSVISNETQEISREEVNSNEIDQVERALIDISARVPVLFYFSSAIFWLLVQTVIGVIVSIKLNWPQFLDGCSFLTYGKLVPVQNSIAVYGWASMAGLGVAIWLLARLCRTALPSPGLLLTGGAIWNLGLTGGVIGILAGGSRGFEFLEMPHSAFQLLFIGYSLIAVWGVIAFLNRRPGHIYITVWYIVAALFWFPWLLGSAYIFIGTNNASGLHGVMKAIVGAWYAQNLLALWLGGLGLGAIYYFIPKVLGRPIHSYYLASFGFWTFAVFASWTGLQRLSGGPVPAWLVTVSVTGAFLMMVPVATVTANYWLTMKGNFGSIASSPTIRFIAFGAVSYTIANVVFLVGSFRTVSEITQYTWFGVAENQLFIYAFFSMVMFGSFYYIVPRMVGCEWISATFIRIHFWGSTYGFGASILFLATAGLWQGSSQAVLNIVDASHPHADFMLSVAAMQPLLIGRTMAQILICLGVFTFALHFLLMLFRLGRPSSLEPTLFPKNEGHH